MEQTIPKSGSEMPRSLRTRLHWLLQGFSRLSIILLVATICAGNVTNSFFLKWGFRDDQRPEIYNADNYLESYSLAGMMYGSAPKPFVYRAAVPRAIKWAVDKLDPAWQAKIFAGIKENDSLRKSFAS
ncbi:MAG TPA: hypothetical protein VKP68_13745, partial [Ramlibacter sp.]|nr:hypothetical protein [Ramlibacter sp.]